MKDPENTTETPIIVNKNVKEYKEVVVDNQVLSEKVAATTGEVIKIINVCFTVLKNTDPNAALNVLGQLKKSINPETMRQKKARDEANKRGLLKVAEPEVHPDGVKGGE